MRKIDRFDKYMEYSKLNDNKVTVQLGLSVGTIGKSRKEGRDLSDKVIELILNFYTDLDDVWLLTGKGSMLRSDEEQNSTTQVEIPASKTDNEYKLIPLFNIDSVGGMHSTNEVTQDTPQYIETYVPFHLAQDGDIAIKETGDSMIPTIPPGSIMQLRRVETWQDYIGYGNIFVILLNDGRRITKEIRRYEQAPANFYWCVSHNPEVANEELPKKLITEVWKVLKILTDRGW